MSTGHRRFAFPAFSVTHRSTASPTQTTGLMVLQAYPAKPWSNARGRAAQGGADESQLSIAVAIAQPIHDRPEGSRTQFGHGFGDGTPLLFGDQPLQIHHLSGLQSLGHVPLDRGDSQTAIQGDLID